MIGVNFFNLEPLRLSFPNGQSIKLILGALKGEINLISQDVILGLFFKCNQWILVGQLPQVSIGGRYMVPCATSDLSYWILRYIKFKVLRFELNQIFAISI